MPSRSDDRITFLARTNFRERKALFGIRQADRLHHMYVIGKTGTGKSTLFESMARQDMEAGRGFALLDPHGDLVERLVASVPKHRRADLIYFNAPDASHPLGFNPLNGVAPEKRALASSGLLDAFKRLWPESWGPRLEHILRNALLLLLDQPEATLTDVLRLFDDEAYRKRAAGRTSNAQVRRFWLDEFGNYPKGFRAEAVAPIQNKVGAFLADPILHRILTQRQGALDLRRIMDDGKILLVNLAKGKLGNDPGALLGSLLVSQIGLAALGRAEAPEDKRRAFFLYLDEFHAFTTRSIASMLSELRKYHVGLVLAHQYCAQLDEEVRDAVLGNVGTIIAFRVGAADAEALERDFLPEFGAEDLLNLPNYQVYVRLMVEGKTTRPFSGVSEQA